MIYRAVTGGRELIARIREELPITPLPPEASFIAWLSSLESLLWGEIVRERKVASLTVVGGRCSLAAIPVGEGEGPVLSADLTAVYKSGEELRHASPEDILLFSPASLLWTRSGVREIAVGGAAEGERLDCVYLVRPAARTAEGEDAPLALPEEFVELAAAKLRGEACRLAGEDALCAKWFSDYNAKLESFAAWCDRRRGGAA